jgi:hypothetical protein
MFTFGPRDPILVAYFCMSVNNHKCLWCEVCHAIVHFEPLRRRMEMNRVREQLHTFIFVSPLGLR